MKLSIKLSGWLSVLSVLIFLLIVVGGMVRNLQAGLSCPDWPLCFGKIIPPLDIRVFSEWFHRLFAASVSFLTLIVAVWIFRNPSLKRSLGASMITALLLLISQVVLGGLTVLQLLKSEIVTLHLATGTAFFATILFMSLKAKNQEGEFSSKPATNSDQVTAARLNQGTLAKLSTWSSVAFIALYCQIILGGVVSSHYAGLACPDFPTCLGSFWPGLGGNVGIQFLHRLGATAVFIIISVFGAQLFKARAISKTFHTRAFGLFTLLFIQIALGIANVVLRLPVAVSVTHLAVAEALFALLLISTYEIHVFKLR